MSGLTALIPARGGSKGVPRKNIRHLAGYPLIAYSILACKRSSLIDRIVVSTDDEEIATVSILFGAEVPFIRPSEHSKDTSKDIDVIKHFYSVEGEQDLAFIRPTTPLREPQIMDKIILEYQAKRDDITGLRSAHELSESPYKYFKIENGLFAGFFDEFNGIKDYANLPRQVFPAAYHPNGYIDIVKKETVLAGSDFGQKVLPAITKHVIEVDDEYHFSMLETDIQLNGSKLHQELRNDQN
jgi:CMP-N,N'-diacetyllegionaminic acid synthase